MKKYLPLWNFVALALVVLTTVSGSRPSFTILILGTIPFALALWATTSESNRLCLIAKLVNIGFILLGASRILKYLQFGISLKLIGFILVLVVFPVLNVIYLTSKREGVRR